MSYLIEKGVSKMLLSITGSNRRRPRKLVNMVTCYNLGRLTVSDARLHGREVPTITVGELLTAMKGEA